MSADPPKVGRPTDYSPEFCQQAADLCANGATDKDLAEAFDVSDRTIYRWQAAHPEFSQALRAGKELADERVVRSLYHKAVGYTFDAVKIMQYEGAPVVVPYQEHVPPDTGAAMFWLKNRRPSDWRDRSSLEHSGPDGGPIAVEDVGLTRVINRLNDLRQRVSSRDSGLATAERADRDPERTE